MGNDNTANIRVTADTDKAVSGLGNVNKAVDSLSSIVGASVPIFGMMASAAAAVGLTELAKDAALAAARVETLGVVMQAVGNNAGYTAVQMDTYAKGVAKSGITTEESRQAVIRMAQSNLDLSKSSQLARVAQDAAVIANTNSSQAFSNMILGMSTGQAVILHHMGLMVNFERAYMTTAQQLGKTKDALSETERSQARLNEVMRVSTGIAGSYEAAMGTAGKQLNSLDRWFKEIKVSSGEAFTPVMAKVISDVTAELKKLYEAIDKHNKEDKKTGNNGLLSDLYDDVKIMGNGIIGDFDRIKIAYYDLKGILGEVGKRSPLGAGGGLDNYFNGVIAQAPKDAAATRQDLQDLKDRNKVLSTTYGPDDPSDVMRLKMGKDNAEYAKIEDGNRRREDEAQAERLAEVQRKIDRRKESWEKEKIGLKAIIEEMDPLLTEWARKELEIDRKADQDLQKNGMVPGASDLINKARKAQKDKIAHDVDNEMAIDAVVNSDSYINATGKMSPQQQKRFDDSAARQNWKVQEDAYNKQEEESEFTHGGVMAGMADALSQKKLAALGEQRGALIEQFNFEQQQAEREMNWKLDHVSGEEREKARIKEEYAAKRLLSEQELSQKQADLWANSAQKYVGYAQEMTTMGIQLLLADESQKNQIGARMLGTSIRFISQGLQQYMMGKAKEHLLNAAAMAGAVQTKTVQAATEMTIGGTQAAAWAAYFTAMSMNPFGGQAFIPAATAMTAATVGFGVAAGGIAAAGATGMASELSMAAVWAAGGIAAGALGEAGASSIENRSAGSSNSSTVSSGGVASNPVVSQPGATNQQQGNVYVQIKMDNVYGDQDQLKRWAENTLAPVMRDAGTRNIIFISE